MTVFWDEFGLAGSGWDTHWEHYPRMKNELMPGFDKGFAGLIADLDQRGMLDDTLVVVLSEHGRTPKLSSGKGGGRDHWSQAYTTIFAGGGVARGRVIGKTDKIGGTVADGQYRRKICWRRCIICWVTIWKRCCGTRPIGRKHWCPAGRC